MTTSVNEASTQTAASATDADRKRSALVWDLPTRLFHWSLAVCFAGAWLTSDSERQHLLHLLFGYSLFGLILFRIVWGAVGSRYARFSQFAHGPVATWAYVKSMLHGRPAAHVGHNPAGAIAIWLLLGLGLATAGVGVTMIAGGGEAFEDIHEALATAMLVVVGLHLLGVAAGSVLHRENLPRAMVTGRKHGLSPDQGIGSASVAIGLALLLALGAFWAMGLSSGQPPLGLPGGASDEAATDAGERSENGMRRENDEDGDEDD